MSVFITGGAGYIGSHVAWALKDFNANKDGAEDTGIICLDNLGLGFKKLLPDDVVFIQGDTRDRDLLKDVFSKHKITSVVHFAAFKDTAESILKPFDYFDNNFGGTCTLLEVCRDFGVKNFVFSSTAAVYAPQNTGIVNEIAKLDPVTPYGQSKLMSERMIMDCSVAWGLNYIVLRYFNVAGADSKARTGPLGGHHTALIKQAAEVASGKKPTLTIFGNDYPTRDGTGVRDYIHVEDLADLHIQALKHLEAGKPSQILNCGYGHGYSVLEVADEVSKCLGKKINIQVGPRRAGDLAEVVADVSKMKNLWNWHPKKDSLTEICGSTLRWEQSVT